MTGSATKIKWLQKVSVSVPCASENDMEKDYNSEKHILLGLSIL